MRRRRGRKIRSLVSITMILFYISHHTDITGQIVLLWTTTCFFLNILVYYELRYKRRCNLTVRQMVNAERPIPVIHTLLVPVANVNSLPLSDAGASGWGILFLNNFIEVRSGSISYVVLFSLGCSVGWDITVGWKPSRINGWCLTVNV